MGSMLGGVRWIPIILAGGLLLGLACKPSRVSHPISSFRRVYSLMVDVGKLQDRYYSDRRQYGAFDELPLPTKGTWGEASVSSPTSARFEEYDLLLAVTKDRYCIAAFPVREPPAERVEALWRDHKGKIFYVRYPWREVPVTCDMVDAKDLPSTVN